MPATVLSTLYKLTSSILTLTLWGRYYDPHFRAEKTDTQKCVAEARDHVTDKQVSKSRLNPQSRKHSHLGKT